MTKIMIPVSLQVVLFKVIPLPSDCSHGFYHQTTLCSLVLTSPRPALVRRDPRPPNASDGVCMLIQQGGIANNAAYLNCTVASLSSNQNWFINQSELV